LGYLSENSKLRNKPMVERRQELMRSKAVKAVICVHRPLSAFSLCLGFGWHWIKIDIHESATLVTR
jgi:hypothetical protein